MRWWSRPGTGDTQGCLKGATIAPAESARCYQQFVGQGGLDHEFRYRVWREAMAYAGADWGAKCIAIDDFSLAEGGIAASHLAGVRRIGMECENASLSAAIAIEDRGGVEVIHILQ